jgi:cardiolipin synthase
MVEVQGPAARELRAVFYETWRRVLKRRERRDPAKLPRDAGVLSDSPPREVWVIANRKRPTRRAIRATYVRWILGARAAIDVVNAYFVPDRVIRRALISAARRGVRVRVLVPEQSDLTFVQWAVETTLERLAVHGIEAYAYRGAILHAKTAVIDDDLVTVGSYNLDRRSFRYNLEVNVAAKSAAFAMRVRQSIEQDLAHSTRWTLESLQSRGWIRRLLGWFAMLFARFL